MQQKEKYVRKDVNVMMTMPAELKEMIDSLVADLRTNRTQYIRDLVVADLTARGRLVIDTSPKLLPRLPKHRRPPNGAEVAREKI